MINYYFHIITFFGLHINISTKKGAEAPFFPRQFDYFCGVAQDAAGAPVAAAFPKPGDGAVAERA